MVGRDANKLENYSKFYKKVKKLEQDLSKEDIGFTKKEVLKLGKEKDKLKDFRRNLK